MPNQTTQPTLPKDGYSACQRYNEIHHRLVQIQLERPSTPVLRAHDLAELREHFDVFVLDGFGVLNVGEEAIDGAAARVQQLRASGAHVLVLTNGASFPHRHITAKYQSLGFEFDEQDIISSRLALANYLSDSALARQWGFMAHSASYIEELAKGAVQLADNPSTYEQVSGFVLLGSANWTANRQHLLLKSLQHNPRPVLVGNPDLVAPRAASLSLEPGYYAHQLADALGVTPHYFGKPFRNAFDLANRRVAQLTQCSPQRIAMVGDTLHTDILGGAAAGWQTVLVTDHGLMKGLDIDQQCAMSGIYPNFIVQTT